VRTFGIDAGRPRFRSEGLDNSALRNAFTLNGSAIDTEQA
jgi:hypothetical protein